MTLEDPCDPPFVQNWGLSHREYTISDVGQTYTIDPVIALTPSFCVVEITATIPNGLNEKLSFDEDTQTFTLPQFSDSLDLAGHPITTWNDHIISV